MTPQQRIAYYFSCICLQEQSERAAGFLVPRQRVVGKSTRLAFWEGLCTLRSCGNEERASEKKMLSGIDDMTGDHISRAAL